MAGSRPLNPDEQRELVRRARRLRPRDRALICAQLFLGFRISEILALTVGHVVHRGGIASHIRLPPRLLKGGYGTTRAVPVGPELARALGRYLATRGPLAELSPTAPLFVSRQRGEGGGLAPLCRSSAEKIIKRALLALCPADPGGLSTHSLRKSWACRLYEESGHDILCVRDGLGHSSVSVTQVYLPVNRQRLEELMIRADWTRARVKRARVSSPSPPADELGPASSIPAVAETAA